MKLFTLNDLIVSLAVSVLIVTPSVYSSYQRPDRTYALIPVAGVLLLAGILDLKGKRRDL